MGGGSWILLQNLSISCHKLQKVIFFHPVSVANFCGLCYTLGKVRVRLRRLRRMGTTEKINLRPWVLQGRI